jgi:methyl-accepting chemotaxis protein
MEDVVSSVKRVTDIMAEITAASREQASGIEQVNQAITQMDGVTQQNAALVEAAATAADSLQKQARRVIEATSAFKLQTAAVSTGGIVEREARRVPNRAPNVARLRGKPGKAQSAAPRVRLAAGGGGESTWEQF